MAEPRQPSALGPEGPPPACRVETYSGSRLHERPRRFTWEGEWLAVTRVLAAWREPGLLFFKVAAGDGRVFVLRYETGPETWTVRLVESRA